MVEVTADKMEQIKTEYETMMHEMENDKTVSINFWSDCSLQ